MKANKIIGIIIGLSLIVGLIVVAIRLMDQDNVADATRSPRSISVASGNKDAEDPESHLRWISIDKLPKEAKQTLSLIDANGPFPYPKDGSIFRNAERVLPKKPGDYYKEYTVVTPNESDRGARRIVCGQTKDCYYTADHYKTFERIRR